MARTPLILALALIAAFYGGFSLLVHNTLRGSLVELHSRNHATLSKIITQGLLGYFRRLQYVTEYTAADVAFQPARNTKEDRGRFEFVPQFDAERTTHDLRIDAILNRRNPTAPIEISNGQVRAWQIFKGLPEIDKAGNLIAARRRILARDLLRTFADIHYVFEEEAGNLTSGDLVFLEPFDIQKNIASFNYKFRDYLRAVQRTHHTELSEGYISGDTERTQIISVASPIFDPDGALSRIFVASIANSTVRDRVFRPLSEGLSLDDETAFYLIDRHGHIVAGSSGSRGYQPKMRAATDEGDPGNIRTFGLLTQIKWTDDQFESGNEWQRATKTWDSGSLRNAYTGTYINWNNISVLGTFYPISILSNERKWGILIETPIGSIENGANQLRSVLTVCGVLLGLCLLMLRWALASHERRIALVMNTRRSRLDGTISRLAHDIRSPLVALQMLFPSLCDLPEHVVAMITGATDRLSQIADDLSVGLAEQDKKRSLNPKVTDNSIELMSSTLAILVSQKRLEYRRRGNLVIDFVPTSTGYGVFCKVIKSDFERVISNLVNNSAEAITGAGNIVLSLSSDRSFATITIRDDGGGLPPEVLPRLFERGATFGKLNGKGLGLYFAKQTILTFGGDISISSQTKGAMVTITLPIAPTPEWFCDSLEVPTSGEIVIIDDDESIHDVWRQRFRTLVEANPDLTLIHAYTPKDLLDRTSHQAVGVDRLYLVDYEFRGSSFNGLTLIETLGIKGNSVLVTASHDQQQSVRSRALRLKVRILPKSMAPLVPIVLRLGTVFTGERSR